VTGTNPEFHATLRQQVERRRVACHKNWMSQIVVQDQRANPKLGRYGRYCIKGNQRRPQVVQDVIGHKDGVEADVFGPSSVVFPFHAGSSAEHL
jgi:hypothetical protein